MSKFVNYTKRDVALPTGCKDLIDVLQPRGVPWPIKSIASASELPSVTRGGMTIGLLSEVPRHVDRLIRSRSVLFTLMISTTDKQLSMMVYRNEGEGLSALAMVSGDAQRERSIRDFLQRHDIALLKDYLLPAEAGAVPVRGLIYSLPPAPPQASQTITELFRSVCGYADEPKVRFQFYELA